MNHDLLIFGGESTALEIFETIETHCADDFSKVLLVIRDGEKIDSAYNFINDSEVKSYVKKNRCFYIIGFTNQNLRKQMQDTMKSLSVKPTNIIHPSSTIFNSARIGAGNYIGANTVISHKAKISNHCIININSTIGHNSIIESNCIILPGARVGGNVSLGKRVLIGSNSFILQGKSIGDDCLVDALTYVDRDISNNNICTSKKLNVLKRVV